MSPFQFKTDNSKTHVFFPDNTKANNSKTHVSYPDYSLKLPTARPMTPEI